MATKAKRVKIIRDSIQGITKPALKRLLAMVSGNVDIRLGGLCYEELRGILKVELEELMRKATLLTAHAKRRTINASDVDHGAELAWGAKYGKYLPADESQVETVKDIKKVRKLAAKSASGILVIGKAHMKRLVTEIKQDLDLEIGTPGKDVVVVPGTEVRISSLALLHIRILVESRLIEILGLAAQNMTSLTKRRTLSPKDLYLARRIVLGEDATAVTGPKRKIHRKKAAAAKKK